MITIHMSLKSSRSVSFNRAGYATIAALILFVSLSAQNPNRPLKLSTNEPIDGQIKGGETHIYEVTLNKGEYARAEVEQKNIDVVVSLFDANGKLVVEMDGKDGRLWHESVSMIAKSGKAAFQVKIRAYGGSGHVGDYRIKLAEVRPTNANDGKRLKAEIHLSKGRTFYEQLRSQAAANEYEIATALFRELGDSQQEAITLTNLGQAFFRLSEYDRSIIANKRAMELFQKTKDRLGEAKTVNTLGSNYRALEQPDKARQFFEKALAIRREVKDRNGEGGTIYNLGLLHYNLLDYKKSGGTLYTSSGHFSGNKRPRQRRQRSE
ncbi:MAG: tetratricopeptide repeat protein [Acidobacteria bacterium]|nr:tetratricopeptide repeat protein [Acidobacteriota bacterium]